MKRLMICIALMSSASAFAGPIQEGAMLLIQGKAQAAKNKISLEIVRNKVKNVASDLKELDVKSKDLKKINAVCSASLLAKVDPYIDFLEYGYVTNSNAELSRFYEALKLNVASLESAKKCNDCDAEVRKLTIEKYSANVSRLLEFMNNEIQDIPSDVEASLTQTKICNYSQLFSFDDSKIYKELKNWNAVYETAELSPSEVLSGEFDETLDLIARKSPIKVKRTASRLSSESSSYKHGVVNINVSYTNGIFSGFDHVKHPELTNAVMIIHRDR